MSEETNNKEEKDRDLLSLLRQLLGRVKSSTLFPSILAAIVATVGFWLSPLKERVYYYLYPPKPIVSADLISVRNPIMRGDVFIVKLHLVPDNINLAAGQVRADVPTDYLTLEDGNSTVDFNGSEKVTVITYKFDAEKAGKALLKYVYIFAKGGSLQRDIEVNIVDRKAGFPTFSDLSGEWSLMWDRGLGQLEITQNATRISGKFSMTEADIRREFSGEITGFANGYNVRLILVPDKSHPTEKTIPKVIYANLLRISGTHNLTICGRVNGEKDEPFVGQVTDPNASVQEICKGSNFLATAQLR